MHAVNERYEAFDALRPEQRHEALREMLREIVRLQNEIWYWQTTGRWPGDSLGDVARGRP